MDFRLTPSIRDYLQTHLPKGYSLVRGGIKELQKQERNALKKVHTESLIVQPRQTRRELASENTKSLYVSQKESKASSPLPSKKGSETEAFPLQFTIPKPSTMISFPKPEPSIVSEKIAPEKENEEQSEKLSEKPPLSSKSRPQRQKKNNCLIKLPFKSAINIEKHGDAFQKGMFNILQLLQSHKSSPPFTEPIDPIEQGIPDYFDIIEKPMDLRTVESKVLTSQYTSMEDFVGDCNLIWSNAKTYNAPYSITFAQAVDMENVFELLVRRFESHYKKYEGVPDFYRFKRKITSLTEKAKKLFKPKEIPERRFISRDAVEDLELSQYEKDQRLSLARNIKKLPLYTLRNIPDFIDFGDDNDVEIDIQRLSNEDFNYFKSFIEAKIQAFSRKDLDKIEDSVGSGWSSASDSEDSVISLLLS